METIDNIQEFGKRWKETGFDAAAVVRDKYRKTMNRPYMLHAREISETALINAGGSFAVWTAIDTIFRQPLIYALVDADSAKIGSIIGAGLVTGIEAAVQSYRVT